MCLALTSLQALAQGSIYRKIDSLERLLGTTVADTTKVNLMIDLSQRWSELRSFDSAVQMATQALRLAEQTGFLLGAVAAYQLLGDIHFNQYQYAEAERYHQLALATSSRAGHKNKIANSYSSIGKVKQAQGNITEAIRNYEAALGLYEQTGYKRGLASIHLSMGELNTVQQDRTAALGHLSVSLRLFEELGDKMNISLCLNNIGIVRYNEGNYSEALKHYRSALAISQEVGSKKWIAGAHNNIAVVLDDQGNYAEALRHYLASLNAYEELGDKRGMATCHNNIAALHINNGNPKEALAGYEAALRLYQEADDPRGTATALLNIGGTLNIRAALDICERIGDENCMAYINGMLGEQMCDAGNRTEGLKYHLRAISLVEKLGDSALMAVGYGGLGECLASSDDPDELRSASDYLLKALSIGIRIGNMGVVVGAYKTLSKAESALGHFAQALEYYKLHVQYKDSLFNEESDKQISQLRVQYETEKKDKEIVLLNKDREISALELARRQSELEREQLASLQKSQQMDLLMSEQQMQQLLLDKNAVEIEKQKSDLEGKNKENELLAKEAELQASTTSRQRIQRNSILSGAGLVFIIGLLMFNGYRVTQRQKRQAERMRISSDLHDEIGSTLSSILLVSDYAKNKPEMAGEVLGEIAGSSQQMIEDMNDIIWAINPHNDNFQKIVDRLHTYAFNMTQSKNVVLDFRNDASLGDVNLSMEERKNLYLICKEAANNAMKYSNCQTLTVHLLKEKRVLVARVSDDGSGFDTLSLGEGRGEAKNGLRNMRRRAESMGASLDIKSSAGSGTEVRLEMGIA